MQKYRLIGSSKRWHWVWAGMLLLLLVLPAMAQQSITLPDTEAGWTLAVEAIASRKPSNLGTLEVRGTGDLSFDPAAVTTLRPDVFQDGHFSVFDVLVHLAESEQIELEYAFDEVLQTHVIQSLNGLEGWWYDAHFDGGNFDKTVVRMDCFPVKDDMSIVLYLEDPERLNAIYQHFAAEVSSRDPESTEIIIPSVVFRSATQTVEFTNVVVTAHDARIDVFQPGVITALDVLLSLGESGALGTVGLEWRSEEAEIAVVDGYYVVAIQAGEFEPAATGSRVLIHQVLGEEIEDHVSPHTHTLTHIHLTGDLEVLVSPQVVEWLWVCL